MTAPTIGRALRTIREWRGLSQTQMGHLAGLDPSTVCRWELGVKTPDVPSLRSLVRRIEPTDAELSLLVSAALLSGDHASVERRGGSLVVRRAREGVMRNSETT